MVGVYDPNTFLTGFIDPNAKIFAIYNSDKPDYVARGLNPNGGFTELDTGAPVYTLGSVTAGTTLTATGNVTSTTGNVSATTGIISGRELVLLDAVAITQSTTVARTADCSIGSYFNVVILTSDNFTIDATNVTAGQIVVMVINSTAASNTPTITFGTNIRPNGGSATLLITTGTAATITFIGLGTALVELSRVATIAAS
jgi:hypothetical protein